MVLGCIADDFTGASDLGNVLSRGGLQTIQFVGVPVGPAPECDAGIVALKSRSIPAAEAVKQSREALSWLRGQGCQRYVFKYCSTFDSTPQGNIGPVAEALAGDLGVRGVVVCPTSVATGRTVYQGHLFVGDRLLHESGMERHPLNPMTDPDLRRWLSLQTEAPVGHVDYRCVRAGAEAISAALRDASRRGETLVVVDAITEEDLSAIDVACRDVPLLTGGSSVALGLPEALVKQGLAVRRPIGFVGLSGPAVVISGSCSDVTLSQVAEYTLSHPLVRIDVDAVMRGDQGVVGALADLLLQQVDDQPLLSSSDARSAVDHNQNRYGPWAVAERLDDLFGCIARRLVQSGVQRLVVAGGETSGAVVNGLNLRTLRIGPQIAPGVPALRSLTEEPTVALALKSGNLGDLGFFERAAWTLGQQLPPYETGAAM